MTRHAVGSDLARPTDNVHAQLTALAYGFGDASCALAIANQVDTFPKGGMKDKALVGPAPKDPSNCEDAEANQERIAADQKIGGDIGEGAKQKGEERDHHQDPGTYVARMGAAAEVVELGEMRADQGQDCHREDLEEGVLVIEGNMTLTTEPDED